MQVKPTFTMGFGFEFAPGYAGMIADNTVKRTDSFAAEVVIGLGLGVIQGTNPQRQVKLPTATGDEATFVGISQVGPAKEQDLEGNVTFAITDTVPVLTLGRIWVPVDGIVAAGAEAKLIVSGADAGKFSATNGVSVTTRKLKFLTSTDEAGIAVVEIY